MPIEFNFEFTNNLDAVLQQISDAAKIGVAKAGEELLTLSKDEAPLDIGTLAGSGAVTSAGDGMTAIVSYDTPYAARLHEHPEYNFAKDSNPNAKGKYLEDPALANAEDLRDIVGQEIRNNG